MEKKLTASILVVSFLLSLMSFNVVATDEKERKEMFRFVTAGTEHTVAIKENGSVIAWGKNNSGQCNVIEGLQGVKSVAAGDQHTVVLKEDGTVVAWGTDHKRQNKVPNGLKDVIKISAKYYHTLALKKDGTVVAWGNNEYGQCFIPYGLTSVKDIAAGLNHSVALKEDGTVVAWGDNETGQLTVPNGLSDVTAIAAGTFHTVALKKDGTVVAWGANFYKQSHIPDGLTGVIAIDANGFNTALLKKDGSLAILGDNTYGQCNVPSQLSSVISLASGENHTVVLREDGSIMAWGKNDYLQCYIPVNEFLPKLDVPNFIKSNIDFKYDENPIKNDLSFNYELKENIEILLKINNPRMYVNGVEKEIDPEKFTTPLLYKDRTIVPIRAIIESFNGYVGWDEISKKVTLKLNNKEILVWAGRNVAIVNGAFNTLDVEPITINGRTMLPIRFIAETLGLNVKWDRMDKVVSINNFIR